MSKYDNKIKLQWEINVPLFRNPFILQGLGMAIGIPFGMMIIIIIVLSKGNIMGTDAKYALGFIALILLLSLIVTQLVYGGIYAAGFLMDKKGITSYTQEAQAKKNRAINRLTVILGLARGNLAAVGTGILAHSRRIMQINWREVRHVYYYPKQSTIIVKGGFAEKMTLFCSPDNYDEVVTFIEDHGKAIMVPQKKPDIYDASERLQ
jgi:hypothetical protein